MNKNSFVFLLEKIYIEKRHRSLLTQFNTIAYFSFINSFHTLFQISTIFPNVLITTYKRKLWNKCNCMILKTLYANKSDREKFFDLVAIETQLKI